MLRQLQNKVFLTKQKSILLTEKAKIEKEMETITKFPNFGKSEESNAREVEEFEGRKGLEKKMRNHLEEVYESLEKLEKNQYGICKVCSGPISLGRLEAFPAASTCVECSDKV